MNPSYSIENPCAKSSKKEKEGWKEGKSTTGENRMGPSRADDQRELKSVRPRCLRRVRYIDLHSPSADRGQAEKSKKEATVDVE